HLFASLEIEGQYATVLGAAEQQAVHVRSAAVGRQQRARIIQARAPVFRARCRVDGENLELGGADQSVVHHDQTGLEGSEHAEVVGAQDLQVPDILGIDLVQRREPLRDRGPVVAWPIPGRRVRPSHIGERRGGRSGYGGFFGGGFV